MRTQFVTVDGVSLAYQVLSEKGPTLLQVPGAISNMALEDGLPAVARYYERMCRFCRVIRFDKRGTGLSDRGVQITTIDRQLRDVAAVFDATGTERAAVCGLSHGAALAVLFAATYPGRVSHLILVDGFCCDARDPYEPLSDTNPLFDWDATVLRMEQDFAGWTRRFADQIFPDMEDAQLDQTATYLQATANLAAYRAIWRGMIGLDLRSLLREIAVPTLILHARGDKVVSVRHGRHFAEHIPGARYVELDTTAHIPWADGKVAPHAMTAIEELLTGQASHSAQRIVVSVLFTDIVASTMQQQARGDEAWRTVRERFESQTASRVEQLGGRVVQFLGDGVMAAFPAPGDGLRAARLMVADAREQGFEIRAGLHAGEAYEVEGALHGTCVTMAARVCAHAGAGEVLTTDVVRGLVEGSELAFTDVGEVDLKGLGPRRLVRLA